MWDGRADTLEQQVLLPLAAPREMNRPLGGVVGVVAAIPGYRALFASAFPDRPITPASIAAAIATYERTIVSGPAPFDAWVDGDEEAIPEAAKHGFELFNTRARCAACHSGWTFTDDGFHDTGLAGDDRGRGALLPDVAKLDHAFKTPGLRDVADRAPYMHDGSLPTLAAVVAHYNSGGIDRPSRSRLIAPLGLSSAEQADLVAFLRTLTSFADGGAWHHRCHADHGETACARIGRSPSPFRCWSRSPPLRPTMSSTSAAAPSRPTPSRWRAASR